MPLPSELIERLADAGARRELGRLLDALAGAGALRVERGRWAPAWTGLTVVGTPTYAGRYTRLDGRVVFFTVEITAGGANTTASTANATNINNLPFRVAAHNVCAAVDLGGVVSYGLGGIPAGTTRADTPTWGATNAALVVSGWYEVG
jgi:hypothetical protein